MVGDSHFKKRGDNMKEEKPIVDNSDIMMIDINDLMGSDKFTMVNAHNGEEISKEKESED